MHGRVHDRLAHAAGVAATEAIVRQAGVGNIAGFCGGVWVLVVIVGGYYAEEVVYYLGDDVLCAFWHGEQDVASGFFYVVLECNKNGYNNGNQI